MIKLLSIAGSDPSGGAGVQVDLKTFQALGVFGMAVPAALTVQNSRGVAGVEKISSAAVARQVRALFSDIKPKAVKTGMLPTKGVVEVVAAAIRKYRIRNVVVDPVFRSGSGSRLTTDEAVRVLKRRLLPLTLIVTPNIPEAEILSGVAIETERDMDFAAGRIMDLGPKYVLVKGGHRRGPAIDTLYGGRTVLGFSTPRRKGEFHGTGCVLSSAIAVFIARGLPVEKAVEKAKQFVDTMLKKALPAGKNKRVNYFQF
jgi:hydroxymethylpyrimidine kinase/phosphomethylpyrimidine kinase